MLRAAAKKKFFLIKMFFKKERLGQKHREREDMRTWGEGGISNPRREASGGTRISDGCLQTVKQ